MSSPLLSTFFRIFSDFVSFGSRGSRSRVVVKALFSTSMQRQPPRLVSCDRAEPAYLGMLGPLNGSTKRGRVGVWGIPALRESELGSRDPSFSPSAYSTSDAGAGRKTLSLQTSGCLEKRREPISRRPAQPCCSWRQYRLTPLRPLSGKTWTLGFDPRQYVSPGCARLLGRKPPPRFVATLATWYHDLREHPRDAPLRAGGGGPRLVMTMATVDSRNVAPSQGLATAANARDVSVVFLVWLQVPLSVRGMR
ncbi:uncharacterized protein BDZ83DRAFT_111365 [Colletotrichum acutatum]|uniref:Uncharacterized protein n=1 Tax=Glomerella acutata TaxID=27357 RepID=A0AAD8UCM7_GLOAC|nr:uncharacterized protein BDZ83DRAFT_111365 [Colletotrichum acutatum]KAK1711550.1 hypothetical protein BDZ83DRAFT_111365 [Colletotrichum acutatum]